MPLWLVLLLAYLFEFANGWTDAPNSIATAVSTRVLRPHHAVLMAGVMNLVGALVGTAVAKTIAEGIVDPDYVTLTTIGAAVLAATIWALGAQYFGLPSSESHALVAALLGAGFAAGGLQALEWSGTRKSLIGLVTSPVGGFLFGFVLMIVIYRLFSHVRRSTVGRVFGKAQILSAGFMAFSHGTNDAQKTMGIITGVLVTGGYLKTFEVPIWVILSAHAAIALGTLTGGWRIVHTMGARLTRLRPRSGFCAETAAAASILLATELKVGVSTTHVIGGAIAGVGSIQRVKAVRWGVAANIVWAWVLTIPAAAAVAALFFVVLRFFVPGI